jgi:hypothetical protein
MKEALKLALEALMDNEHYVAENERHAYVVLYNEVIDKCKAALAQDEASSSRAAQPAQEPWVGLTEAQFLEATRLAENGNYLVAFGRIQGWLKEKNT